MNTGSAMLFNCNAPMSMGSTGLFNYNAPMSIGDTMLFNYTAPCRHLASLGKKSDERLTLYLHDFKQMCWRVLKKKRVRKGLQGNR